MSTAKPSLRQRAIQEFKEFLVIAFYLWLIFGLFLLYKSVVLNGQHISAVAKGFALINALALAKIMLIARAVRLGDWWNDAPLIYPTVLKSALFAMVLAVFKVLEEIGVGLYHQRTLQESLAGLGGGTLRGVFTLTLLLFVMLIPFFGFTELQGVLGEGKLAQLFLHARVVDKQGAAAKGVA